MARPCVVPSALPLDLVTGLALAKPHWHTQWHRGMEHSHTGAGSLETFPLRSSFHAGKKLRKVTK